jgi:hypothetical protein
MLQLFGLIVLACLDQAYQNAAVMISHLCTNIVLKLLSSTGNIPYI